MKLILASDGDKVLDTIDNIDREEWERATSNMFNAMEPLSLFLDVSEEDI